MSCITELGIICTLGFTNKKKRSFIFNTAEYHSIWDLVYYLFTWAEISMGIWIFLVQSLIVSGESGAMFVSEDYYGKAISSVLKVSLVGSYNTG